MPAKNVKLKTHHLVVGDWSNDGHGKYDFVSFEANKSRKEIIEAYQKAEEKSGVGLTSKAKSHILGDYQDNRISKYDCENLEKIGVSLEEFTDEGEEEASIHDASEVCELFLRMVNSQLPDFVFKVTPEKKSSYN